MEEFAKFGFELPAPPWSGFQEAFCWSGRRNLWGPTQRS